MAVRRLSQSFLSTRGRGKASSFIAGYGFGVDEMDLIQRTTVGAGGTASIIFSSIPQTYQHLQLRIISRETGTGTGNNSMRLRINSDSGSNYSVHRLYGNGTSVVADSNASQTGAWIPISAYGGNTANIFALSIVDFLDYASTSKTKTLRALVGGDYNGSGSVNLNSGAWYSTAAVTAISLIPDSANNFAQYTVASLYGVVG